MGYLTTNLFLDFVLRLLDQLSHSVRGSTSRCSRLLLLFLVNKNDFLIDFAYLVDVFDFLTSTKQRFRHFRFFDFLIALRSMADKSGDEVELMQLI